MPAGFKEGGGNVPVDPSHYILSILWDPLKIIDSKVGTLPAAVLKYI